MWRLRDVGFVNSVPTAYCGNVSCTKTGRVADVSNTCAVRIADTNIWLCQFFSTSEQLECSNFTESEVKCKENGRRGVENDFNVGFSGGEVQQVDCWSDQLRLIYKRRGRIPFCRLLYTKYGNRGSTMTRRTVARCFLAQYWDQFLCFFTHRWT